MAASSGAIKAGRAFVELFADDSKMVRGLKAAQGKLAAWGKGISAAGAGIASLGLKTLMGGLAGLAPLAGATKLFANMGSALQDASERTGMAVEELSALQFAAEQSGATFEELENAIKFMQKGGFGSGADDLMKLADQVAAMQDPAEQTAFAMEHFGKAGTKLLPMVKGGAAGIQTMIDRAKALGVVMSSENAAAADKLGDSFGELVTVLKFAAAGIGGALAPVVGQLFSDIMPIVTGTAAWIKENKGLIVTLAKAAALVPLIGAAGMAIGGIVSAIGTGVSLAAGIFGGVIAGIAMMIAVAKAGVATIAFLFTPFGAGLVAATVSIAAVVGVVGGLTVAFFTLTETGKECWAAITEGAADAVQWLSELFHLDAVAEGFRGVQTAAVTAWGGIVNAVKAGDLVGAMKVIWAGVKAAWASGIGGIRIAWLGFSTDMANRWDLFNTALKSQWLTTWHSIRITFITSANAIIASLNEIIDTFKAIGGVNLGRLNPLDAAGAAADFGNDIRQNALDNMARNKARDADRAAGVAGVKDEIREAEKDLLEAVAAVAREGAKQAEVVAQRAQRVTEGAAAATRTGSDKSFVTFSGLAARFWGPQTRLDEKQLEEQKAMREELKAIRGGINRLKPLMIE